VQAGWEPDHVILAVGVRDLRSDLDLVAVQRQAALGQLRGWVQDTIDRYATKLVVEGVSESSDAIMVVVRMSGSFPGSPATARFLFQLVDGLITHLDIKS